MRLRLRTRCKALLSAVLLSAVLLTGGAGCDDAATIAVSIVTEPAYLYVAIRSPGAVQPYTIDPDTGLITANGGAVPAGANTTALAVHPSKRFLYAANFGATTVHGYEIDLGDGTLSAVPGSPFVAGNAPTSVVAEPSGQYVYVTNQVTQDIGRFSVNQTTGALTFLGSTAAGIGPEGLAATPDGAFLYHGTSDGTVVGHAINASTGGLTPVPGSPLSLPATRDPSSIAVNPTGTRLYLAEDGQDEGFVYSINAGNGALTANPSNPFFPGAAPRGIAVDPTDSYVYTANFSSSDVSRFAVQGSGALSVLGPVQPVGPSPQALTIEPTGQYVYVSNQGNDSISVFVLEANGDLTQVAGSPVPTPAIQPQEVVAIALP